MIGANRFDDGGDGAFFPAGPPPNTSEARKERWRYYRTVLIG